MFIPSLHGCNRDGADSLGVARTPQLPPRNDKLALRVRRVWQGTLWALIVFAVCLGYYVSLRLPCSSFTFEVLLVLLLCDAMLLHNCVHWVMELMRGVSA